MVVESVVSCTINNFYDVDPRRCNNKSIQGWQPWSSG